MIDLSKIPTLPPEEMDKSMIKDQTDKLCERARRFTKIIVCE